MRMHTNIHDILRIILIFRFHEAELDIELIQPLPDNGMPIL
jgi:hypothetical protein